LRAGARSVLVVTIVGSVILVDPFLTVAVVGGVWLAARIRPMVARRARRRRIDRDLPDALDLLVLTVRAGLTPRQAVAALIDAAPATIGPACAAVVHRTERGQTFADSLHALPEMLGSAATEVADAISSCERYGLPLEPLLDQLATDARAARRRLADADARKLPVRLSFPLVMCTLPSFVLLAIAPAVMAALSSLGASRP
jgi:tight adherence protein C